MVTITVSTALWGDGSYYRFLDRWWTGVESLQRQPDEILMVVDQAASSVVKESTPRQYQDIMRPHVVTTDSFTERWHEANALSGCDWVAACAIDDWFLPERLNEVEWADDRGFEQILDGCIMHPVGNVWSAWYDPDQVFTHHCKPTPGDGIKKVEMFRRVGGFDMDVKWVDWAWLMKLAVNDIRVHVSDLIGFVADEGFDHVTWSGAHVDAHTKALADREVKDYGQRLKHGMSG